MQKVSPMLIFLFFHFHLELWCIFRCHCASRISAVHRSKWKWTKCKVLQVLNTQLRDPHQNMKKRSNVLIHLKTWYIVLSEPYKENRTAYKDLVESTP